MQERGRGADAAAFVNRALRVGDAFLGRAVIILVAWNAEALRTGDEGLAQRIAPVDVGDGQRPVAAVIGVFAVANAPLQPLEVGQHVGIAPAAIADLRPGVEVAALAAIIDVAVDRRGAAERLAARREDAPAGSVLAWLLRITPVDARVVECLDETGGQMNVRMPVGGTGFQHADACCRVFAQAIGQHAAGRAGADDHIVEGVHRLPFVLSEATEITAAAGLFGTENRGGEGRERRTKSLPRDAAFK